MAYQPCVARIAPGSGYSKVNSPATVVGRIRCVQGEGWIKLRNAATVSSTGFNGAINDPDDASDIVSGWTYLFSGDEMHFGSEPPNDGLRIDPVAQLDFYSDVDTIMIVDQH